jgi:8-oxo-dGTP pyrophosphatase MutT (NUDIX family)
MKDAATVLLVRDGPAGLEVFLQRRVAGMAFAAGMTVFPGGGVDATDGDADLAWAGPSPDWWARQFGVSTSLAKALVCAAVRETFEECGVLLAGSGPDTLVTDTGVFRAARAELERHEITLARFLAREKLVLRADLLRPRANWITPESEPRRYDTRFFLAVLPAGQSADGATTESAHSAWATPAAGLAQWRSGTALLMPPTWQQLETLSGFGTAAEAFADTPVIEPIMPVWRATVLEFPGSERYHAQAPSAGEHR